MGLRYRYFVWLDKTFNKYYDISEDREGLDSFSPQDEYNLVDQILLGIATPLAVIVAGCHKLNERLSVQSEKISEKFKVSSDNPNKLEEKKP